MIIIGPRVQNRAAGEDEERVIKVRLNGEGSVAEQLRRAADVIDGTV